MSSGVRTLPVAFSVSDVTVSVQFGGYASGFSALMRFATCVISVCAAASEMPGASRAVSGRNSLPLWYCSGVSATGVQISVRRLKKSR